MRISSCLIVVGTVAGVRGTDVKQSAANRLDGYFRLDVSIVGEARSAKCPMSTTSAPEQGASSDSRRNAGAAAQSCHRRNARGELAA